MSTNKTKARNERIKAMRMSGISNKEVALHFGLTEASIYMIFPVPEHMKKFVKPGANKAELVPANLIDRSNPSELSFSLADKIAIERTQKLYPPESNKHWGAHSGCGQMPGVAKNDDDFYDAGEVQL